MQKLMLLIFFVLSVYMDICDEADSEPSPPSPYLQYLPSFAQSWPIGILIKEAMTALVAYYIMPPAFDEAFYGSMAAPHGTRLPPLTRRNNQGRVSEPPVFLIAEYNGRKVTIPRTASYQGTLASIKKNFRRLKRTANSQIVLLARFEEADDYIFVPEDMWHDLLPRLMVIRVALVNHSSSVWSDGCTGGYNPLLSERDARPRHPGFMANNTRALPLDRDIKIAKPVIYLFPPAMTANVRVELALTRFWTFSAIYPPTTVAASTKDTELLGESIAWTVNAQPDGTLWDQSTEREVTYLFWEARNTEPRLLSSPPTTRPSSPIEIPSHSFDPANPTILPSHSALLSFDKVTGYIDDALIALGLHTEARTSFITYWLPDLSKHAFIALRFLPQKEYEKSAPMNVSPAPDVVTRVFMLFQGVDERQIGLWNGTGMVHTDATVWRDIVGVDLAKVHDKSLFRVVEWGGMEVK